MKMKIFDTDYETALRIVILLSVTEGRSCSMDQIVAYDFMASYGDVFDMAKQAVNGENVFCFSEIAARRERVKHAIKILAQQGMIEVIGDETGFSYRISAQGKSVFKALDVVYAKDYGEAARKVTEKYEGYREEELLKLIGKASVEALRR